ncbi:MAG: type II secretion system F family protein [Lachnospiraceae bacterium]|nr:type II secretion system F family protein [Lachnospiraceae bacterium]
MITVFLIAAFCGNILGGIMTWTEAGGETQTVDYLLRNGAGEDAYTEEVQLHKGGQEETVTVQVEPQTYTKQEVQILLQDALDKLSQLILGDNETMEHIDHNLNLIETVPDTNIAVSWTSDHPEYVDWEGMLSAQIPREGAAVCLTAELSCQGETRIYKQYLNAFPSMETDADTLQAQVDQAVTEQNDRAEEKLLLPEEILDQTVQWTREVTHTGWILLGIGILAGVFYGVSQNNQEKTTLQERQKQMNLDYPQIVNKLILLMNAGMSMRKAFSKIALDYQLALQRGKKRRCAYDEVLVAYREMESGVLETDAYQRFGDRCDNIHYKTFTTLLIQNLRKGSRELVHMLEREGMEAFEERKARARVLGEEAGTKLLLPMVLMFVLVLVILMIPAYMSF